MYWILPLIISGLALADGAIHIVLDIVIFRGNFFGRLGPPPGAPAGPPPGPPVPLPLPLNQLFLLNFVGYVVLVALLWFVLLRLPTWLRRMDGLIVAYVAVVFLGWVDLGEPNPMGLGYLSKGIELVLLAALLTYAWVLSSSSAAVGDRRAAVHP